MWYLVIPPIIVVVSLSFLLWYLSRKGSDPVIAEQISHTEEEKPGFSRTKEFFLRLLEKWAQRFKVASLRTHNSLHEFTQSVKKSRRKIQGDTFSDAIHEEGESREEVLPVTDKKEGFFTRLRAAKKDISLEEPIIRHKREEKENEGKEEGVPVHITSTQTEVVPRPMVSETVAEPEIRKKRVKPNVSREESLIARIAVNPKDFTAYEELGDYYLEIENIKDAKECYRQVLKLSPVHRMVKIKIRRLEKLLTREGE